MHSHTHTHTLSGPTCQASTNAASSFTERERIEKAQRPFDFENDSSESQKWSS